MSKKSKQFKKGLLTGVLGVVCAELGLGLGLGMVFKDSVITDPGFVTKLGVLERMIDEYYLEETREEDLKEGLYTGLLYGLGDPYSRYYTAEEYEEENSSTQELMWASAL